MIILSFFMVSLSLVVFLAKFLRIQINSGLFAFWLIFLFFFSVFAIRAYAMQLGCKDLGNLSLFHFLLVIYKPF